MYQFLKISFSRFLDQIDKVVTISDDEALSSLFGEIERDVVRTFRSHPLFMSKSFGENMLMHILKALALAFPDIGYCQVSSLMNIFAYFYFLVMSLTDIFHKGMNFVAATLILARLPEEFGISPSVNHLTLLDEGVN